jgi:NTP pyrophosphatase (non-canonical NTP hydrolase)
VTLDNLEELLWEWGVDKGILPYPDPVAQFEKTVEEVEELKEAIIFGDRDEVRDAIGDIFVTLVMQTQAWDLYMGECVQQAYNQIKNRKGRMVNGQFVKEQE